MNDTKKKSIAMFTLSMVIYGSIGIFRRLIPISSSVLVCLRGLLGAILLAGVSLVRRRKLISKLSGKLILLLIISGALIGINWMLLFESYEYTTVAVATLSYYMAPTIVVLISPIFLNEKITLKKGICALVAIAGMFPVSGVISEGIPDISELRGIVYGLGAAAIYAAVMIINKKLPQVDPTDKTIVQLFAAAIVMLPYILITDDLESVTFSASAVILVLIVGFVHTGLAYSLFFAGIDGLPAQTAAILCYIDPITALILSSLILHEHMDIYGIIGAIAVIGAAFISEVDFRKRAAS